MKHLKIFIIGLIAIFFLMWLAKEPDIEHISGLQNEEALSMATLFTDQAKLENKTLLLYFSGEQCPPCMALEQNVFSTEKWKNHVAANLHFVPMQFPLRMEPSNSHIMNQYRLAQGLGSTATPFLVLIDQQGNILKRQVGYNGAGTEALIDWTSL